MLKQGLKGVIIIYKKNKLYRVLTSDLGRHLIDDCVFKSCVDNRFGCLLFYDNNTMLYFDKYGIFYRSYVYEYRSMYA